MPVDRWAKRLARVDTRVDDKMAETIRFVPLTPGPYSGMQPDTTRPAFEVNGLLSIKHGTTDLGGDASHQQRTRIITGDAMIEVRRELIAGRVLRRDDRVEAPMQGLTFLISHQDLITPGRIVFHLTFANEGAS